MNEIKFEFIDGTYDYYRDVPDAEVEKIESRVVRGHPAICIQGDIIRTEYIGRIKTFKTNK